MIFKTHFGLLDMIFRYLCIRRSLKYAFDIQGCIFFTALVCLMCSDYKLPLPDICSSWRLIILLTISPPTEPFCLEVRSPLYPCFNGTPSSDATSYLNLSSAVLAYGTSGVEELLFIAIPPVLCVKYICDFICRFDICACVGCNLLWLHP